MTARRAAARVTRCRRPGGRKVRNRVDPELAARAVFRVLAERVTGGEIEDVKQLLPAEVLDLWP